MENDAQRFREMADECLQQAERVVSPLIKERWLKLAGDWIKMAQESENRQRK